MPSPPSKPADKASTPATATAPPPGPAPVPARTNNSNSTPVKHNSQGSERFKAKTHPNAEALKVDMAQELAGQWVGPMPVGDFLKEFLPLPGTLTARSMPKWKNEYFASLNEKPKSEDEMYEPFIEKIKASKALPGFDLVKTAHHSDPNTPTAMRGKPDVSVYAEDVNRGGVTTSFEHMEFAFEFKPPYATADPFNDKKVTEKGVLHPFEAKSKDNGVIGKREKCRGQIASYATALCARQHRTHCFMVWVGGPRARLIRFDRSGAVVSAKFNYRKQGRLLLGFLWRYSRATQETRGYDTTVSEASSEESEAAKAALEEWKPKQERKVLKMQIPDAKKGTPRSVFVWHPMAEPFSVTGRATRGYPGWDPKGDGEKGAVVFVKDSWRSCEDGMEKESAILQGLKDAHCEHVPILVCGDDIPGQSTITKEYVDKSWNLGGRADNIVARVHTRFAQDFVGYHLETFKTSRQLIQAIYDALLAHKFAYEKCKILHRDISASNILLTKEGGGILNDWDMAKRTNADPVARQPHRSGTWQFMSAALLLEPGKLNTLQDDMESAFWLVLYHVLRYLPHNQIPKLQNIMESIFDQEHQQTAESPVCGGLGKKAVLRDREHIGFGFIVEGNKPLTYLVRALLTHWSEWYGSVTANQLVVERVMFEEDISREEAVERHPFDPRGLAMNNYDAMLKAFDTALEMKTWPPDDKAVDRLPYKIGRGLDAINEDEAQVQDPTEPNVAKPAETATRETKRLRTSRKGKTSDMLKDEDPYMPRSGSELNLRSRTMGSRESNGVQARRDYSGQDCDDRNEPWPSCNESESDPDVEVQRASDFEGEEECN